LDHFVGVIWRAVIALIESSDEDLFSVVVEFSGKSPQIGDSNHLCWSVSQSWSM